MLKEMEHNGPKITKNSIVNLESSLKKQLPNEYKAFLLEYNGGEPIQRAIDFDAQELRINGDYIATFYEVSDDITYGILPNIENHAGLIPQDMIFIAISPEGNYFLLSLREDSYGEVFYKDHEIEDKTTLNINSGILPESMIRIAGNFKSFISMLYDPDGV